MAWRLAHALETLRMEVNARWPDRSKDSDGSIGDEHHSARTSDHNPDDHGVVRAIDITHDPKHGFDSYKFADILLAGQDPRLKYVISNRRIGSGPAGPQPGVWRKYTGTNPHDHHVHISVVADNRGDVTAPWMIDTTTMPPPNPAIQLPRPTIKRGSVGQDVEDLQASLVINGMRLAVDGRFGAMTEKAVIEVQRQGDIVADGIVGPQTWHLVATLPKVA